MNEREKSVLKELRDAARALRKDSWRHTVDWGTREPREAIEKRVDAALRAASGALRRGRARA